MSARLKKYFQSRVQTGSNCVRIVSYVCHGMYCTYHLHTSYKLRGEQSHKCACRLRFFFFFFVLLYVSYDTRRHVCVLPFWLLLAIACFAACCCRLLAFTCSAAFVRDLPLLLLPRTRNPAYLIWLAFTVAPQTVICCPTTLLQRLPSPPPIEWCTLPGLAVATLPGRSALSPETLVLSWPADFRAAAAAAALEGRR